MSRTRGPRTLIWSALSGVVSAAALLAVSEAIAAVIAPQASPLLAVGSFVVDVVPRPLKEFAISTFGDNDKLFLLVSLGIAAAIGAALAGFLQYLRAPIGAILLAIGGAAATAAILTRAEASVLSVIPPVLGTVVGVAVLIMLVSRLRRWAAASATTIASADLVAEAEGTAPADPARVNRRSFLLLSGLTAVASVIVGVGARVVNAASSSIESIRDALRLPAPASTVAVPAGAELDVPGISPLFTSNADFYRVDTALTVPQVDPDTWKLVIDGMVGTRVELSFDDLIGMGLDEYIITLTCVSNEVGGDLVGNARWLGVPVRTLLAKAAPSADADMVLSRSVDGYTASTPLSSLTDENVDAILAVGMNGEPLPLEHGFPVRMIVPGLYGYVSATKWLTELKVTTFAQDQAYWTPRGYSAQAPIKMSSRVDTPKLGTAVSAGTVAVAGMAWAQGIGISRVEVQIDDGEWQSAQLSAAINDDTWVQWMLPWDASSGTHYISVRAVDKAGNLQIQDAAPIAPNGSSGWQRTLVTVT
ncbi:molybdopterin-dependent oxidoreductase [Microbacterium sp. NPDC091313]